MCAMKPYRSWKCCNRVCLGYQVLCPWQPFYLFGVLCSLLHEDYAASEMTTAQFMEWTCRKLVSPKQTCKSVARRAFQFRLVYWHLWWRRRVHIGMLNTPISVNISNIGPVVDFFFTPQYCVRLHDPKTTHSQLVVFKWPKTIIAFDLSRLQNSHLQRF